MDKMPTTCGLFSEAGEPPMAGYESRVLLDEVLIVTLGWTYESPRRGSLISRKE